MPALHLNSVPGSRLTGPAMWAAGRARAAQWDWLVASPDRVHRAQVDILKAHLDHAAQTEFGRAHGFAEIASSSDIEGTFRRRLPVRTYAEFEPYLQRMRRGERDVLYPGLIPYYGQSSGTSSTAAQHKFLPISLAQIRLQQRAGFDLLARYLTLSGDRAYTGGYTLQLFPPGIVRREGPVGIASNPGLMQLHMPRISRHMVLPHAAERDIEDYEKKLGAIADTYLDYDVRGMTGTTCWFSIFFDKLIAAARARGRHVSTVSEIWPNLGMLAGGGVPAAPYRGIIADRLGRRPYLMDNYNATEGGIFASTWSLDDDSLLMIPDRGVYFEFVRRGEDTGPDARRVPLCEVERDVDYSVVLTTTSGLYSYMIGDYVRFTSLFPHRIKFAGRKSGVLSLTQELTTQLEIEQAVARASTATRSALVDFAAGPDIGVGGTAKGRYSLFVEFEREPVAADQAEGTFAREFDAGLREQNRVYREHRLGDVAILAPEVVTLPRGTTKRFMEALGRTSVQNKFPHILDERQGRILRDLALSATLPNTAQAGTATPSE